jgi:hypothetical protein
MTEQFFEVPRIGTGEKDDPRRAKYSDDEEIERSSVNGILSDESECIVLFEGGTTEDIAEKRCNPID